MITRPATYETCDCCGSRKIVAYEEIGCDQCLRTIDQQKDGGRFDVTVFLHGGEAQHFYFDSVACAVQWLQQWKAPEDFHFITMPILYSADQVRYFVRQAEKVSAKR